MKPTSMLADHLALDLLPDWMRTEAIVSRINHYMAGRKSADWRFLANLAVDESKLKAPHRSVLRVLISMSPGSSWALKTISDRSGVSRPNLRRVVGDLEADGWLSVDRTTGGTHMGHRWHVLIPDTQPPDRMSSPGRRRAPRLLGSDDGPLSVCNPYPSQTERDPSQTDRGPLSVCNPRDLKEPRADVREESPALPNPLSGARGRWQAIARMIQEHEYGQTIPKHDQRLFADVIAGLHGEGVEDETVELILSSCTERRGDFDRPIEVLADVLALTVGEAFDARNDHHNRMRERETAA